MKTFFGSQSGAYTAADPGGPAPIAGAPAWSAGASLPGLPPAATPPVMPGPYPGGVTTNFQVLGGYTTVFNDGLPLATRTGAKATIADVVNPTPTDTFGARIDIPLWKFRQAPGAPGYAWEQMNFAADYVKLGGGLVGASPTTPLYALGSTSTLGTPFVQLDGQVDYTWIPFGSSSNLGTPVPLGSLNYSFYSATGGPFFSGPIVPTGTLAATPAGNGILELTGYFWVGGDPFDITISSDINSVPEPSTFGLIGVASLALLRRRKH